METTLGGKTNELTMATDKILLVKIYKKTGPHKKVMIIKALFA